MLHILFWLLALALLSLFGLLCVGAAIGTLPVVPGVAAALTTLAACLTAGWLADRTTR